MVTQPRRSASGGVVRAVTFEAGYAFQYQNYDQNLNNGYFDPSDFIANLAIGRARGKFGSTHYYWEAEGTVGLQSFELPKAAWPRWPSRCEKTGRLTACGALWFGDAL